MATGGRVHGVHSHRLGRRLLQMAEALATLPLAPDPSDPESPQNAQMTPVTHRQTIHLHHLP